MSLMPIAADVKVIPVEAPPDGRPFRGKDESMPPRLPASAGSPPDGPVAGHLAPDPGGEDKALTLMIEFDLGEHRPGQGTLMDIDLPGQTGVRHKEARLHDEWPIADGAQHLLSVRAGDLVLRPADARPGPLDGEPPFVLFEPHTDLATAEAGNETVAQAAAAGGHRLHSPFATRNLRSIS